MGYLIKTMMGTVSIRKPFSEPGRVQARQGMMTENHPGV